jgi:serine/threonine-protein kinase
MLLGLLVLVAAAAIGAAIYFATRDDGPSGSTTTSSVLTVTQPQPAPAATKVFVPDVTGLKQQAAVQRLTQAKLVPIVELTPANKPAGVVARQEPKAAAQVKKVTKVTIVVSKGVASVAVPDVSGMKVAAATSSLEAAGFKAATTTVTAPGKPGGTVVSQAPTAGTKKQKGALITLSVAGGKPGATTTAAATTTTTAATTTAATTTAPAPTPAPPANATVPDLSSLDVQGASQALSKANLKATIQYVPGTDPLGTVVAQNPAAGGTAKALAHVTVNVSSGPNASQQATVPNTVGQQLQQAVQTLNGAGLRLIFVKLPVTTRAQVGKVVEQTPLAGKQAPKNAQVLVYLGVLKSG